MAKLIELKGISKSYDDEKVLNSINLYIRDKEFITLLGPSGCGKTTTLRIIGGFEVADEGELYFDGVEISDVPAYKRQVNTVFQKYALFPHLNVYENIAFPLRLKKTPEDKIRERVSEMLKMVALSGFENKSVSTLSGGQQQRVLLARALCSTGKLIVLDEPVSGLDPLVTAEMYELIDTLNKEDGITVIMVSHDIASAVKYSSKILHLGRQPLFFGTTEDYKKSHIGKFFMAGGNGQ